jgi:hypothetical protein
VRGRIIPTNSACTSGAQAIGYAYESIKYGQQDVMIAGGADEMHFTTAVTFDLMFATSANFNEPDLSPRPFDLKRDGLVVGEGAGTLILESLERAQARGATDPRRDPRLRHQLRRHPHHRPVGVRHARRDGPGLRDAGIGPPSVDYVNAHGTATDIGDIAESARPGRSSTARPHLLEQELHRPHHGRLRGDRGRLLPRHAARRVPRPDPQPRGGRPPLRRPRLHPRAPPRSRAPS